MWAALFHQGFELVFGLWLWAEDTKPWVFLFSPGVSGDTFFCCSPYPHSTRTELVFNHSPSFNRSPEIWQSSAASFCLSLLKGCGCKEGWVFQTTPSVTCTLLAIHFHQSQADLHGSPAGIHVGGLCQSRVIDLLVLVRELRLWRKVFSRKKH